jgi:hypothetical protein
MAQPQLGCYRNSKFYILRKRFTNVTHCLVSIIFLNFTNTSSKPKKGSIIFKNIPYARHHNPLCIRNRSWILTIHKARILRKKPLEKTFLAFKKWVKSIQTAGYNGTRTVLNLRKLKSSKTEKSWERIKIYQIFEHIIAFRKSGNKIPSRYNKITMHCDINHQLIP